jgi:hypothetical protein
MALHDLTLIFRMVVAANSVIHWEVNELGAADFARNRQL